jgi:hypothetical protein
MSAQPSAEAFLLFTRHVWGSKIDFFHEAHSSLLLWVRSGCSTVYTICIVWITIFGISHFFCSCFHVTFGHEHLGTLTLRRDGGSRSVSDPITFFASSSMEGKMRCTRWGPAARLAVAVAEEGWW